MGMYDELRCEYPLPAKDAQDRTYQTKDTPSQFLDTYIIRPDGTLWHELYDTEDRSDPNAEGLMRLFGSMTRVNQRWEQIADFTGEISFYDFADGGNWLEFSAHFKDGQLQQLNLVADEREPA